MYNFIILYIIFIKYLHFKWNNVHQYASVYV